jgi:hypothetical protein
MNISRRKFFATICATAFLASGLAVKVTKSVEHIEAVAGAQKSINKTAEVQVALTQIDIINLQKIASTEVVPSLRGKAFESQVHGVVDTVLNRLVTGHWGGTISDVGNSRWQFSGINSNLKHAYGVLEKMPKAHINKRVAAEVVKYLHDRAAGAPSSVGKHLNYLNPIYSSQKSLKEWGNDVVAQASKSGLVFGAGKARHYHGTAKGSSKLRVKNYAVVMPQPSA